MPFIGSAAHSELANSATASNNIALRISNILLTEQLSGTIAGYRPLFAHMACLEHLHALKSGRLQIHLAQQGMVARVRAQGKRRHEEKIDNP
jgi:hypothetical protein